MIIIRHSVKTKATPEAIWAVWAEVENWRKWDHSVEASGLEGPFENGTIGWLKTKGGPKVKFELLDTQKNVSFSNRSFLPLARLEFKHFISRENGETIVTHEVEMTGLLTFLFSRVIGNGIKRDLPGAMQTLIRLAVET